MAPRTYDIEAEQVLPEDFVPGEAIDVIERSDLQQLMMDAAVVLERVGGTFSISAVRRQIADENGNATDLWVPFRYRARWEPFAPGIRVQPPAQEAPAPAPEPEPEPEDIGPDPEAEPAPADAFDLADDDFGPDAEAALAAAGQG